MDLAILDKAILIDHFLERLVAHEVVMNFVEFAFTWIACRIADREPKLSAVAISQTVDQSAFSCA